MPAALYVHVQTVALGLAAHALIIALSPAATVAMALSRTPTSALPTFTMARFFNSTDCSGPLMFNGTLAIADGLCSYSPTVHVPSTPYHSSRAVCSGGVGSSLSGALFTDFACSTVPVATLNETSCIPTPLASLYKSMRVACGTAAKAVVLLRDYTDAACSERATYSSAARQHPIDVCVGGLNKWTRVNASYVGLYVYNGGGADPSMSCAGTPALVSLIGPLGKCLSAGHSASAMYSLEVSALQPFLPPSPTRPSSGTSVTVGLLAVVAVLGGFMMCCEGPCAVSTQRGFGACRCPAHRAPA